jgi:P4 family phage/plasmid primase-like protien
MTDRSLKERNIWLNWKYEDKGGKLSKVPYSPRDNRRVGTDAKDRNRLSDFQTAVNNDKSYNGIGFVFTKFSDNLHICGIDIDHRDLQSDFVRVICDSFPGAYIEKSPSGEGLHIVILADISRIPTETVIENGAERIKLHSRYYMKKQSSGLECYISGLTNRYFTFTGNCLHQGRDIDETDALLQFLDKYMRKPEKQTAGQERKSTAKTPITLSDNELLEKARNSKNGAEFTALFDRGDTSKYNGDDSAADLALMNYLAFWTACDCDRMERLFGLSAPGKRNKWTQRGDYRRMTITKAIDSCGNVYEPKRFYARDNTLKPGDYSDVGQAEILSREYGEVLRYSEATDFISYNGSYWEECKPKSQGAAQELTARQLEEANIHFNNAVRKFEEKGFAGTDKLTKQKLENTIKDNSEAIKIYPEWAAAYTYREYAVKARDTKKITAALKEVRPMVLIDAAELDNNPYLFNTPQGTFDLQTGEEHAHNAKDYITKCTSVNPSYTGAEIWSEFLQKVFCNDNSVIDYVQNIVGLCAISKVCIEALIICYGDGRNGKSTFWNPIFNVLGSYAGAISSDALTANCKHNARPELAELRGKTAVLVKELGEGKRLEEKMLKNLTSTDKIDAEKKYKAPFQFTPTHTTVMYTNFLPKIGSRDAGTKRRLLVIPFTAKFEGNTDKKNYGDYLYRNAGGAILKWIIEGAKEVIRKNFHIEPPEIVKTATEEYINAFDWLSEFLDSCCVIGKSEQEKSGELYTAYLTHCDRINESYRRKPQDFNEALRSAGFERIQTGGSKKPAFFKGLRLRKDNEIEIDIEPLDEYFLK